MENEKLTMTVDEAAHLLGISRGLAYEMVRIGKIPSVRFGKRLLVPRRTLERMLEQSEFINSRNETGISAYRNAEVNSTTRGRRPEYG